MAHSYASNLIHLVFSTKDRRPMIASDLQLPLWRNIVAIGGNHKIIVIAVGGMADHAHVLFSLPQSMALAKAIQVLKANSSRWMRVHEPRFAWQEGYGAFSVSASNKDAVVAYIDNQEHHHKKSSFEQEFVALLKKHQIDYDFEYVLG